MQLVTILKFFILISSILILPTQIFSESAKFLSGKVEFICDTRFGKVKGIIPEVSVESLDYSKGTAKILIKTGSLSTSNSLRDSHLKGEDFFHVKKFSHATFEATSLSPISENSFNLIGKLTIKNISKDLIIPVTKTLNGNQVSFSGSVTVNRRDFKMEYDNFVNPIEDKVILKITALLEVK
ncbi:MAG: YceI family protein [Leptospiraceae bacterium]|nr:YceI family protein [Leptospiraceae bacterium]